VALSGIASRRTAAEYIKNKEVTVNDAIVVEPGYRVQPGDIIKYKGTVISPVQDLVYLLLNKPKNVITTVSDAQGRKTVLDLVENATDNRIYPVGRLDRDTTGLLILTNDGDLARKLSHPSNDVKKIYQVTLDRTVSVRDLEKIQAGLELEDGIAEVDAVGHIDGGKRNEIGIEIHIGKNRIVRRIFEHLGYEVEKLDRVYYAGLTKKDLPRGHYRKLTEKELIMLKHFI
jgi:23S rRNA pseudouridine2605 synthase